MKTFRASLLFALLLVGCLQGHAQEKRQKAKELFDNLSRYVSFSGYGQVGYEYDQQPGENSFYIRRIIGSGSLHLHKRIDMFFLFSAGNSMKLYEYGGLFKISEAFNVKVGQMKVPYTMESVMSLSKAEVVEGALPVNYLAALDGSDRAFEGSSTPTGRDFGILLEGRLVNYHLTGDKLLEYAVGVYNGQGVNLRDKNKHKDFAANLAILPARGLKLNGSAYIGKAYAMESRLRDGITQGENYTRNRWCVGIEAKTRFIDLRSEYLEGKNDQAKARGAYATTMIHVYKNVDLVGSVAYLNENVATDDDVYRYVAGAEWRFLRKCRLQLQYQRERNFATSTRNNQLFAQLQLGF